jgi:hypothetical protein
MSSRQAAAVDVTIGDLMAGIATEVDRVALNGSGVGAEPEGLLPKITGGQAISLGTDGGAPTWAKLLDLEYAVGIANGDPGRLGFVSTPAGRRKLRQIEKAAGNGLAWDGGQVLDVPAFATTNLPSNLTKGSGTGLSAAVYGNFADLVVALWGADTIGGAIEVLVDPFTLGTAGGIRVIALLDVDTDVRHAESFAAFKDMATT